MIKTMKKTDVTNKMIVKFASVIVFGPGEMVMVLAFEHSESFLKSFPERRFSLHVDTANDKTRTENSAPKVGHILKNGEPMTAQIKNGRLFVNLPKGYKKSRA